MTLEQIRKSIARNLGLLADDNTTILEGLITKAGLDDEINRIYRDEICQMLMAKHSDEFTEQARSNTYRTYFTLSAIDAVNNIITSNTGVFGRDDIGSKIQNPTEDALYTITDIISGTQAIIEETPEASWIGDTCYILSNVIVLDGTALEDMKEVIKVEIKYNPTDPVWRAARPETTSNFRDSTNMVINTSITNSVSYLLGTIEVDGVNKRCLRYFPYPSRYDGEIKINYTALPAYLSTDTDKVALTVAGVDTVVINGVTAWGHALMSDITKFQVFQGLYTSGLQTVISNFNPRRAAPIRYRGFRSRY